MTALKNILFSIPLGLLYYVLLNKLLIILLKDMSFDTRMQYTIIIMFILSLVLLIILNKIKSMKITKNNKLLIYSLYFFVFFLFINSTFVYWDLMNDYTKVLIIIITISLIFYYYYIF